MDGTALSHRILAGTAERARRFLIRFGRPPCLAAVLVGADRMSTRYAQLKQASCHATGVDMQLVQLPGQSRTLDVVTAVATLSSDPLIDGILVQYPLPIHVDERATFAAIAPDKDIDGLTMHAFAEMALGVPTFPACTAAGIMRLLDEYGVEPSGQHAVVIGRRPSLGKSVGALLLARNATVTYCHSLTSDFPGVVSRADILISAADIPGLVRGHWIKPGATVIDAGYANGTVGDVVFDEALATAGLIAPVPGGVGPMTIAILLEHTVTAAEHIGCGDGM